MSNLNVPSFQSSLVVVFATLIAIDLALSRVSFLVVEELTSKFVVVAELLG
jgi:hypothetical protein